METSQQEITQGIRTGALDLDGLREALESTSASNVSVADWGAAYNSATGQLSAFCTVTSNDSGNPITGLGLMAYSADGATMYALQYSNGFEDIEIMTSIGTSLFNPQSGPQILSVVYGWTPGGSFYQTRVLNIQSDR